MTLRFMAKNVMLYSALEAPLTKSMTFFVMTLKFIAGIIYFFMD